MRCLAVDLELKILDTIELGRHLAIISHALDDDLGTGSTHLILVVEPRDSLAPHRLDHARLGKEEEDGVLHLELHVKEPRVDVDSGSTKIHLLDGEHLLIQLAKLDDVGAAEGEQKSEHMWIEEHVDVLGGFGVDRRSSIAAHLASARALHQSPA